MADSRRTTVLVTGGAGYFGTLLVQRLAESGASVRIFDINRPDHVPPNVDVIQGDVRDSAAVRRACEDVDVIHHNVALVPLARDVDGFRSVNEGGTRNVLSAAKVKGVRKVVHMSSSAIYGAPKQNPVTELTVPVAGEAYGRAKLSAEAACREFRWQGVDVTIIRPRTIMGHGRLGIMQMLFEWVYQGQAIPVLSGGKNTYQFVHADDLADACLLAAEREGPSDYNIGAAHFGTMLETLQGLVRHANTGTKIVSVPMWPASTATLAAGALGLSPLGPYHALMYGRSMWFDTTKAQQELGFKARYSNVEMFCHSYDWYVAHRAEILAKRSGSPHSTAVKQRALRLLPAFLAMLPAADR